MAMVGFKASVDAIVKHRLANKAITIKHQLSTDQAAVANELKKYTRLRLGIPNPAPAPDGSPGFFRRSNSRNRVGAAVAVIKSTTEETVSHIKRAAQGTGVILDWIQAGGDPEPQELAEQRAATCVACPRNVQGAWYTEAPAELLKAAIEDWQRLKGRKFEFQTVQGDRLKSCDVCKCLMRLKVFTPMTHILQRTSADIMAEFPPNCWIKRRQ